MSRQMHLGVFVLGTGNHNAGWRFPGATQSFEDIADIQQIGRIAEPTPACTPASRRSSSR